MNPVTQQTDFSPSPDQARADHFAALIALGERQITVELQPRQDGLLEVRDLGRGGSEPRDGIYFEFTYFSGPEGELDHCEVRITHNQVYEFDGRVDYCCRVDTFEFGSDGGCRLAKRYLSMDRSREEITGEALALRLAYFDAALESVVKSRC